MSRFDAEIAYHRAQVLREAYWIYIGSPVWLLGMAAISPRLEGIGFPPAGIPGLALLGLTVWLVYAVRYLITLGLLASFHGKSWITWVGLTVITSPFGFLLAYPMLKSKIPGLLDAPSVEPQKVGTMRWPHEAEDQSQLLRVAVTSVKWPDLSIARDGEGVELQCPEPIHDRPRNTPHPPVSWSGSVMSAEPRDSTCGVPVTGTISIRDSCGREPSYSFFWTNEPSAIAGTCHSSDAGSLNEPCGDQFDISLECNAAQYEDVVSRLRWAFSARVTTVVLLVHLYYPDREAADHGFWDSTWRTKRDFAVRKWSVALESQTALHPDA